MNNKNVLIVGAGITGCTLAALLERRGIVPTVIDKANVNDPNGTGITVMPKGLQVLGSLEVRSQLEKAGTVLKGCKLYDEHGHELNSFELSTAGIENITLDRGSLLDILRSKLKKTHIRWQTSVSSLKNVEEKVKVTFTNGQTEKFDLVVGADGINSIVRSLIFPDAETEKVGAGVWMLNLPTSCKLNDITYGRLVFGDYRFMALFPYKNTAAVAFTMPLDANVDLRHIDITKAFAGMSKLSDQILENISDEKVNSSHLRQLKLDRWHKGRIILAGDAAHAMMPASGMGATYGMQDVAVLARLITETSIDEWGELPAAYQDVQKPVIDAKQREAYMLGRIMLLSKRNAKIRNQILSRIPRPLLKRMVIR